MKKSTVLKALVNLLPEKFEAKDLLGAIEITRRIESKEFDLEEDEERIRQYKIEQVLGQIIKAWTVSS
jgi:hypothetical protein